MQSRTSFFNGSVFRKNLSRFAPVIILYTLLLILAVMMAWSRSTDNRSYDFVVQLCGMAPMLGIANLVYAALIAQLIFGDLFSSRMCNALHAMPLRRECWFVTNLASGLMYSVIPTGVSALIMLPLLIKTVFAGAWKLAFLFFLIANLEYICMFGIAVFSVMMVGTRLTMVAGYGLINFGAALCYMLVDRIYTPMLYGVVTPTALAEKLFPLNYMMNNLVTVDDTQIFDTFGRMIPGVRGTYSLGENFGSLWWLALVGVLFTLAALVLYRFRNLECAGDAVCSRKLVPVFQVLSALFGAAATVTILDMYINLSGDQEFLTYIFLFCGLVVGWFAGKMLAERSARVFRMRSWAGVAILAVILAASMGLTKLDILKLTERIPVQEDIAKVSLNYTDKTLEDSQDIARILQLHRLALEDRLPANNANAYVLEDGEYVPIEKSSARYWQEGDALPQQRMSDTVNLTYTLKDGKCIRRTYTIWTDTPAGEIVKGFLSRWDMVNRQTVSVDGKPVEELPLVLAGVKNFYCSALSNPDRAFSRAQAETMIQAIQADCAAGNMAIRSAYHDGVFVGTDERGNPIEQDSLYISISSDDYSWSVTVYPESENTIRWLRSNGYLNSGITVGARTTPRWY